MNVFVVRKSYSWKLDICVVIFLDILCNLCARESAAWACESLRTLRFLKGGNKWRSH